MITDWKQLKAIKRKTLFAVDGPDGNRRMNVMVHDRGRKMSSGNMWTKEMANMPDAGPINDGETWIDLYAPLRSK